MVHQVPSCLYQDLARVLGEQASQLSHFRETDVYSRDLGVLTPVDPPSVVGFAVIMVNQSMEINKVEEILVKQVAVLVSVINYCLNKELISL